MRWFLIGMLVVLVAATVLISGCAASTQQQPFGANAAPAAPPDANAAPPGAGSPPTDINAVPPQSGQGQAPMMGNGTFNGTRHFRGMYNGTYNDNGPRRNFTGNFSGRPMGGYGTYNGGAYNGTGTAPTQ